MRKKDVNEFIKKSKYIFIGEIHGTNEIPKSVFKLFYPIIKKNKIIFCLEIPKQADKELYRHLNNKIKKRDFLNSSFLKDAIFDKRITNDILSFYKKLHKYGVIFKGLEDYSNEKIDKRDELMAKRFIEIIKNNLADKYILYIGNMHLIEKPIKIEKFRVNPIKIYLPKDILKKALTIQFYKGDKEKIIFNNETNTVNYNLVLKDI